MHHFEAGFALADGFQRECPDVGGAIHRKAHVQAEPFLDQAEARHTVQVELVAKLAQPLTLVLVEIAIIGIRCLNVTSPLAC